MTKKILVAVDASEPSHRALNFAAALSPDAELILVAAWHLAPEHQRLAAQMAEDHGYTGRISDGARGAAESDLAKAAEIVKGRDVRTQLVEGAPGPAVVEVAKAEGVDAIAVGSRGRGGVSSLLLGSVSHYVLHHAERPVIVVP